MATIGRRAYAEIFGPTVGDRVRLADTSLLIEVEKDCTLAAGSYGEEVKFGGGKTIRDGMAQSQKMRSEGAVDCVMTNALILDHTGIVKADIGHHHRPRHRDHQLRRQHRHSRRYRFTHSFHLPAAD